MIVEERGPHSSLDIERVSRLVTNINTKYAALQRQSAEPHHIVPNTKLAAECAAFDIKSPFMEGRTHERNSLSCPFADLSSLSPLSQPRPAMYWGERELFFAATDLCLYLNGGVNYRTLCLQYQSCTELLLTMLKEDMMMMRGMDLVPCGTLEKIFEVASGIFADMKQLLAANGVISDVGAAKGAVGEGACDRSPSRQKRVNSNESCEEYSLPTALPLAGASSTEHVGGVNSGSDKKKKKMEAKADEKGGVVCDAKCVTDLMSVQLTQRSPLEGVGNAHETSVNSILLTPVKGVKKEKSPRKHETPSFLTENLTRPAQAAALDTHKKNVTATSASSTLNAPAKLNNVRPSSHGAYSLGRPLSSDPLEKLYEETFQNDGMVMFNAVLRFAFFKEYEQCDAARRKELFAKLKNDLESFLTPLLQSCEEPTDLKEGEERMPLRAHYVSQCLKRHVKPNDKLMGLLDAVDEGDGTTTSLDPTNIRLNDTDIKLLAPLLLRLHHLSSLDLSYNDIQNDGVQELCTQLLCHPTIERIDLSGNAFDDAGATALLRLATASQRLKAVNHRGVEFSPHLREALGQQLQQNRAAEQQRLRPCRPPASATEQGHHSKRAHGTRAAPLGRTLDAPERLRTPYLFRNCPSRRPATSTGPFSRSVSRRVRLPYLTAKRGKEAATVDRGGSGGGKRSAKCSLPRAVNRHH